MKKHNILKVVLLSILVVVLFTWLFPTASFQYEFVEGERTQLGIFDLFGYFSELFRYFPYVLLMALATGIFYGVSYKMPAYRILLDNIVSKFKGKESILLSVIMVFIAIIVSVTGLSFGILFIFPFVISLVLLMGYNKLVAASVTVGSTIVGILGTTLGTSTTSYINYALGLEVNSEIITKILLLVIGLVLLIYNVLKYANKTKNDTDKVVEFVPAKKEDNKITKEEIVKDTKKDTKTSKKDTKSTKKDTKTAKKSTKTTKKTASKEKTRAAALKSNETAIKVKNKKKPNIWSYVLVFDIVVVIIAMSMFDWSGVFNIKWFNTALNAVKDFEIAGFPIFAKILGEVGEFGTWSLGVQVPGLILLASLFLAFIYGIKFDDFLDGAISGIKKAMKPAIYMFMLYLVLLISTWNPVQLHFTKFLLGLTKGLNVITMTISAMIASVLNIECIYVGQSTLPYVTTIIEDSSLYPIIGVIFQSIYGLMMLVAPTSVILIGTLAYLDVPYGQWLKHIWKLFVQLLIVLIVIFFILVLI